jgi:hypothetical protein
MEFMQLVTIIIKRNKTVMRITIANDLKFFIAISLQAHQETIPICANISFFGVGTIR